MKRMSGNNGTLQMPKMSRLTTPRFKTSAIITAYPATSNSPIGTSLPNK